MDEGWHVAGMILTVQVAEKRKLAAHTTAQPPASRTAVLYSRAKQAPMAIAIPSSRVRFATFEVDLRSGELHKQGIKIKLHDQPFQVLAMLLEHAGELVTREQLHRDPAPPRLPLHSPHRKRRPAYIGHRRRTSRASSPRRANACTMEQAPHY